MVEEVAHQCNRANLGSFSLGEAKRVANDLQKKVEQLQYNNWGWRDTRNLDLNIIAAMFWQCLLSFELSMHKLNVLTCSNCRRIFLLDKIGSDTCRAMFVIC